MRGLLVVNPVATTTTERVRDVLATALAADLSLDTVVTKGRGHGVELGARAVELGVDVVIALGGDGTVNEIVNGLLQNGPLADGPAFAVVPGGSTNVFVRALGYSASPVEATGELLDALREGRSRRISVGHAEYGDERRWFSFCFGVGLDARVVQRVEEKRSGGRRNSSGLFLRTAAAQLLRGTGRRAPVLDLETTDAFSPSRRGIADSPAPGDTGATVRDAAERGGDSAHPAESEADPQDRQIALGVVCNTRPWTYLEQRPVLACPDASFDTGLDLLGLHQLRTSAVLRTGRQMLSDGRGPHGRNVVRRHDMATIRFRSADPVPVQMDGEYLGESTEILLSHHPRALRVVA
ncbi:Sphingosine/diacylglycerol kinase-like enzyme [Frankia sp. AiPs1]|uniref:diacylglycerol/lipid kinase family protein n=1 Tax=Frankia sp. AiPa1 TaxID=573492 RepID=UPI00202B8A06|nr:diacylglycerol kinase family protein [Frankia sp. AiPa1]MCL9761227.1 diacylglycerol kinase [Frankia sp. AiPa1]